MKQNWQTYGGPMGVRYRIDHDRRKVEIHAGKRGWIKSAVAYEQFERDRAAFYPYADPSYVSRCIKPGDPSCTCGVPNSMQVDDG